MSLLLRTRPNTANSCAGVWALNRLNHKITIFIGTVSCLQQSRLFLWKTQPTVRLELCPGFPTLRTLPQLQSRSLLQGIFNLTCSCALALSVALPSAPLVCFTSCSLPGQPNTSSQDHLLLIIPSPFPFQSIPTSLLALLQVRQAPLEIKLTSPTFRSNFKAKLFHLPLTSAHNNLESVVL